MKKYNELHKIIMNQGELSITKPETITDYEWKYYNQAEALMSEIRMQENYLMDAQKRLESFKALYGEFE